tara:strand:- start:463 stop:834 length:372 start_codon:yes stop_codon:yes gene_type:complete
MHSILQLNKSINLNKIKNSIKNKNNNKYRLPKRYYEEDQEVVYTILHKFSNYDEVVWSLYKNKNRKFVRNQLKLILLEISKLDPSLTWACMKILKRYKDEYNQRKLRSSFVNSNSMVLGESCL